MLNVSPLSPEEKSTLEEGFYNHSKPYFRNRCKSMLLSSEGFKVKDIAKIYKIRTRTIYTWIHRYESFGIMGLSIYSGRGVKSKMNDLSEPQINEIKASIENNPQSLRSVSAQLSKEFGFEITKIMLKRYLKKN
jgi:transposase